MTIIKAIWAQSTNNIIGNNGTLPWKIPSDHKKYREHTINQTVLMGRNTWESLSKPLAQRKHLVLTSHSINHPDITIVHSIEKAISLTDTDILWIIGGTQVYDYCLPYCEELIVTRINMIIEGNNIAPVIPGSFIKKEEISWIDPTTSIECTQETWLNIKQEDLLHTQ